jgi:hypothetical protein
MASSYCRRRRRRRRNSHVDFDDQALNYLGFGTDIYYAGAPWMGAILQWGVGKHSQGVSLGNLDDYGAHP